MAAQRVSGKSLAARVGVSQNYLAIRLRDEKPFTLDDLELIAEQLGDDDVWAFVQEAERRHGETVLAESLRLRPEHFDLAASNHGVDRELPNQDEPA